MVKQFSLKEHQQTPATILGNGRSRLLIDLDQVHAKTITYGCNAIYRDFITDYLIALDGAMVFEIIDANAHLRSRFYAQSQSRLDRKLAQSPNLSEYVTIIPDHLRQNDSGNTALSIAINNQHNLIYLVGFDYRVMPDEPKKYNNVYRSTANYLPESNFGVNVTNQKTWQNRFGALVRKNLATQFVRVNGNDHSIIIPGRNQPNYKEITIEQFKEEISKL